MSGSVLHVHACARDARRRRCCSRASAPICGWCARGTSRCKLAPLRDPGAEAARGLRADRRRHASICCARPASCTCCCRSKPRSASPRFAGIYLIAMAAGVDQQCPRRASACSNPCCCCCCRAVPQDRLLGALVAYRAIYYFAPFAMALALLGAHELWVASRARRALGAAGANVSDCRHALRRSRSRCFSRAPCCCSPAPRPGSAIGSTCCAISCRCPSSSCRICSAAPWAWACW